MLSRRYSLPTPLISHFSGQKHHSQSILLISQASPLSLDRFAVIISKKAYPLAHDRHALKRHLHQALAPTINQPPFYDFVIIVHPHPPSPEAVAAELAALFKKLKS